MANDEEMFDEESDEAKTEAAKETKDLSVLETMNLEMRAIKGIARWLDKLPAESRSRVFKYLEEQRDG